MYLPRLSEYKVSRDMIGSFGGYNRNLRIKENEFYDMRNMSADLYPLLSPRKKRAKVKQLTKANGLFAHNALCWVDGTDLYYDGGKVGEVEDSPKQFVGMGAYIIIWPDKVYYNTHTGEFGSLGNKITTTEPVTLALCRVDGAEYTDYTASDTAPASPSDGQYWIDTGSTPHVLKQWSNTYGMWSSIATPYVKISSETEDIGSGFAEHDGVTISGMEQENLNGEYMLYGAGEKYVIVSAIIDAVITQESGVTIERRIPDMDFITEHNNRLWGCSSANHEIYACALGEPKVWYRFLGLSTDSYAATVGSPGDFTGCTTHLGYVLFFKEDIIHKLYGDKPANFQLMDTNCRGVEKGSEKSLALSNETLYYKARHDICAYNSALPTGVSDALGQERYTNAVAGANAGKYYVSMRDSSGGGVLFVYDEQYGLWHKEDETYATYFAALGPELYYIADNGLYSVGGNDERDFEWFAETGDIGLDSPDHKYVSKIQLRLDVDEGSLVCISVQYDHETEWREEYRINPHTRRNYTVPVIPRRCDTMRIRFSGHGSFRLYSMAKTIEQGSDL